MKNEPCSPDDIVMRAMDAFRREPTSNDAVDRCVLAVRETAPRGPAVRQIVRWSVRLGVVTTAVVACAAVFIPRQASALESLQRVIAAQDPSVLLHSVTYVVRPDGKQSVELEQYAMGDRQRLIMPNGFQDWRSGGDVAHYSPGQVTILHHCPRFEFGAPTPKQILPDKSVLTATLSRNAISDGRRVDLYEIKGRMDESELVEVKIGKDGRPHDQPLPYNIGEDGLKRYDVTGRTIRNAQIERPYSMILSVDHATQRLLRMDRTVEGDGKTIQVWDYPAYSSAFFDLPIKSDTRVIDEGDWTDWAQREAKSGRRPGRPFKIGLGPNPKETPKPAGALSAPARSR